MKKKVRKEGTVRVVEDWLDRAMRENVAEYVRQLDALYAAGENMLGYTVGLAKAKFIRAKYYGEAYPQMYSLIFHPHQIKTKVGNTSMYDQLRRSGREGMAGIAGLRTVTRDGMISRAVNTAYPIGATKIPYDFPNERAKELILEFGGTGARVLDPCHGWGGRLVGALLADASEYVGCDPCKETSEGVRRIKEAFLPYCPETRRVELVCKCYEDCDFEEGYFDVAITSPPYFDVEEYFGDEQSHVRYPDFRLWVERFYQPLIERTYRWLKDGGVFILQVGSQKYPLRVYGKRLATQAGFIVEDIRRFKDTENTLHGTSRNGEELLVLRKTLMI